MVHMEELSPTAQIAMRRILPLIVGSMNPPPTDAYADGYVSGNQIAPMALEYGTEVAGEIFSVITDPPSLLEALRPYLAQEV